MSPRSLCLNVALRHALQARIVVGAEPRTIRCVIEQFAMVGWQVLAFASEKHSQDAVSFLPQRKAYRVGITLGGQPTAASCITQIAA